MNTGCVCLAAAIFIHGSVNTRLEGLLVERCDGNAVMVSGFNRNTSILHSEIRWTGDSAIASWGITDELSEDGRRGFDGTDGNHVSSAPLVPWLLAA